MGKICGALKDCSPYPRTNLSKSAMSYNLLSSKSCHPSKSEAYRVYNSLYPPNTQVHGYIISQSTIYVKENFKRQKDRETESPKNFMMLDQDASSLL